MKYHNIFEQKEIDYRIQVSHNIEKKEEENNIEENKNEDLNKNENEDSEKKNIENFEVEKNSEPEIVNNEYDDIIKELKQQLKNERNMHSNEIQRLKNELNNKNTNIKNVSQTNTNLKNSLEQLSLKVDKLIEQSQNSVIRDYKVRKERVLSPEVDLKIKENELKNSQTLVNILAKDNNRLKNLIENYSATSSNYDLNMKIYEKKQECEQIKIEIKKLQVKIL